MFVRPSAIVEQFGINPGDHIIDCGAGNGTFTFLMAERVGKNGSVTALDVQKSLVDTIVKEARDRDMNQVTALGVDLERPYGVPLKDGVADVALLANILFQVHNKKECITESARLVRHGGTIIVIEWRDSFGGIGPHLDYIVPEERVHALCDECGLLYRESLDLGPYQYGVIFQKI